MMEQTPTEQNPCAISKCRSEGTIRIGREVRLCELHAGAIWENVEWRDAKQRDQSIDGIEWRDQVRVEARAIRDVERRKPTSMGQIYYVRVNDLIKVGWTSKLAERVRSYGPDAELLANYPATRSDEAALHRQLAPSRYRGREWYSDTDIVQAFITEALERHGPPRFQRIEWTEPKTTNVRPKQWSGR
jgi:hypothetical protein